jgi:deoxyribonuclease-4
MYDDELGVHVSTAGGLENAPPRASELESRNLQLFTKQPNRWAEPVLGEEQRRAFVKAREEERIRVAVAHDCYLINLASPNGDLWERSCRSFVAELERCRAFGLDFLVTHPGNATDGDRESGIARNAEGVTRALSAVTGTTAVLLELTAGAGTSVGGSLENLAAIIDRIPADFHPRLGICFDTCHAYSAGYDLVRDYEGVWMAVNDVLGLERLRLFHLNDSKHPFASHRDRHQHLGKGSLGSGPFHRLMLDERFTDVPKLLETPKEDDPEANDRRNLAFLRAFRL